ncbi:MAG: GNAT family N-acetyltransferase [Rhodospirillaceae bacterium]|nr:GNAT family N-acetyltransferase [Rhodospirillaceae bacterium]
MTLIFPPLVTPRLILRCPESRDAADVSRLITPGVARWVGTWSHPFTPPMAMERIKGARVWAAEHKAAPFAVTRKDDGAFMGWIGVTKNAPDRDGTTRATLGYWLGEDFHGHGYMREAGPRVVQAAFTWLDVAVIDAVAQLANAASFAVMKACGMAHVDDRMVFAPSRNADEMCGVYEARRA